MDAMKDPEIKPNNSNAEDDSQPMEVDVVPLGNQPKPDILKLDIDCFEELFDWLSLVDLHAVGQTCTRLRQYAGFVFRQTYPSAHIECKNGDIFIGDTQINGFCNFVRSISIGEDDLQCFHFLGSNEFKSLNQITLRNISLTAEKIACIKSILNKVEVVELVRCTIGGEFYEEFLKYCPDVKRLWVEAFVCPDPIFEVTEGDDTYYPDESDQKPIIGIDNSWMLRKYLKLEYLGLTNIQSIYHEMDKLVPFFEINTNVRKFATSGDYFAWSEVDPNLESVQFDELTLLYEDFENDMVDGFFDQLAEMKYSRLQFYDFFYWLPNNAKAIEKLHMTRFNMWSMNLSFLVNLKELCIPEIIPSPLFGDAIGAEVWVNKCTNLERVSIEKASLKEMETFITRAPKLNTITIHAMKETEDGANIDLVKWSQERGRLAQAQKVTVFVEESVYLAVKWTTRETSYKFIELKRFETYEWSHDFGFRC